MIDLDYYQVVVDTQKDPKILKAELQDLIQEVHDYLFVDSTNKQEWIGVDLDGTLAEYKKFVSPVYIGDPIPKMVERVKKWVSEGKRVKIFTARISPMTAKHNGSSTYEVRNVINKWCLKHLGFTLEVTNQKDHLMCELWDDLSLINVEKNTGEYKNTVWFEI